MSRIKSKKTAASAARPSLQAHDRSVGFGNEPVFLDQLSDQYLAENSYKAVNMTANTVNDPNLSGIQLEAHEVQKLVFSNSNAVVADSARDREQIMKGNMDLVNNLLAD